MKRTGHRGAMVKRPLAAVALLAASACSSGQELEFTDWLLPVPEGTPIREYAPVPLEGRDPEAVQLVEDLVIGADLSNPAAVLFNPASVVATEAGNIFVRDTGSIDVKMFGPDGAFIKTLGKEGQGPGEFGRVTSMAIAADRLVVNDSRNRRYSIWTLDGEHVADHAPVNRVSLSGMEGLGDGSLVGLTFEFNEDRTTRTTLARQTMEGEPIAEVLEGLLSSPETILDRNDPRAFMQTFIDSYDQPRMVFAATGELLVVTPLHEYQVIGLTPAGEAVWATRVAWQRSPWPENQKAPMIESLMRSLPGSDPPRPSDIDWPDAAPAVASLDTDGHGRVHVFPTGDNPNYPDPPDEWPVDVYSPSGEFIAAGVVPYRWSYALGDYVYVLRPDMYDEREVVRFRLVVDE